MNALNVRNLLRLFPTHSDASLDRYWQVTQLCLLILPFNALLGGVSLFVNSALLWGRYANQFVQSLLNQVLVLLGAWMVIIALFSDRRDLSLPGLLNFLPFFVVFIAQSFLFREARQLRQLAMLLVMPSVPISILAVAQVMWGWSFHWTILSIGGGDGVILDWVLHPGGVPLGRASSLFYYATILASYLVMTFTVSVGLWTDAMAQPPKLGEFKFNELRSIGRGVRQGVGRVFGEWLFQSRLGLTIVMLLNAIALFLTQSRNAWGIGLGIVIVFAVLMGYRWVVGLVSSLVIAVLEAAYAPPPLNGWFRTVVPRQVWGRVNDELFLGRPVETLRLTQWKFAVSMMQQKPLTGWGLRNFSMLYEAATNYYIGHPHNLMLMLACEMGIPATVVFYAIVGVVVGRGVQMVGRLSAFEGRSLVMIVLAFLGCTIFSFFDVPIFDARINLLGWMLLAGIWGVVQRQVAIGNTGAGGARLGG